MALSFTAEGCGKGWETYIGANKCYAFVDEEMVCFLNEFAFFVILRNGPSNFIFDLLIYKWGAKLLSIFLQYHLFPILSLLETTFKFIWAHWIIKLLNINPRFVDIQFSSSQSKLFHLFANDNASDTIYLDVSLGFQ